MADYIPQGDGDFNAWQTNFVSYVSNNTAGLGLVAGDVTPLTTAQTAWNTGYAAHVTAAAAAQSARENKDAKRAAFEAAIRPLVKRLQASSSVDDGERQAMGITVRDTTPTAAGPPTTRPVASIDPSERLRHVVHFGDEELPTSKAKPQGVMGAEIWVKVGTAPPVDPSVSASPRFPSDSAVPPSVTAPSRAGRISSAWPHRSYCVGRIQMLGATSATAGSDICSQTFQMAVPWRAAGGGSGGVGRDDHPSASPRCRSPR